MTKKKCILSAASKVKKAAYEAARKKHPEKRQSWDEIMQGEPKQLIAESNAQDDGDTLCRRCRGAVAS